MPELPDLNVYAASLENKLGGQTATDARSIKTKRLNVSEIELRTALQGAVLNDVNRSGKEIVFEFSNGHKVRIHLMLKGFFELADGNPESVKYARTALQFDSADWLVVADPQGWAITELDPYPSSVPDALDEGFSFESFDSAVNNYGKKVVKALLLDQEVVRGIGNAYADEILFEAKVAPGSICAEIPSEVRRQLYDAIRAVLVQATQDLERLHPGIIGGEFREFLRVHRKDVEVTDSGEVIRKGKVAGRTAYFTNSQVLYK